MATRIYSVSLGGNQYTVTDGIGLATTLGMELTIDLAKITTREDALIAMDHIRDYIVSGLWLPA